MNIFTTLHNKYKEAQQKSQNKEEFQTFVMQAISDGKLTAEEIQQIESKKNELGLTEDEIKSIKTQAYLEAFRIAKADQQISPEEEKELGKIQSHFGVLEHQVENTKKELTRFRLLYDIQQGNIPLVQISNVILQKDEKAYWSEPANLIEEKVIRRKYVGGSSGGSIRIMKGLSYRVGSYRGHSVSKTGLVIVSKGDLIVTNKRVIFRGDNKSFAAKLDNLLDMQIFSNGLRLTEVNKSTPRIIRFQEIGNHDILGSILSYAINHYAT